MDKIEQIAKALAFHDGWNGWNIDPKFHDEYWAKWPDDNQSSYGEAGEEHIQMGRNHYREAAKIAVGILNG